MKKINNTLFLELYNKGLNDTEMSKILNVNNATVTFHRQKLGLLKNFKYVTGISEDVFLEHYNKGLRDYEISKILNISVNSIKYMRNKLNLKRTEKPVHLTKFQRSVLIGTILGDGHLRISNINAYGDFAHSLKQKEYALNKYDILKNICFPPKEESFIDKRSNKTYNRIHVRFSASSYLTDIYKMTYKEKKKIISKEILSEFNEISLAYLFMDDGYKVRDGYAISTNCFDTESLINLKQLFNDKFDIDFSIWKSHIVYIPVRYAKKFKSIVSPYIIDSMLYKL